MISPTLRIGFEVQRHVIGALLMRELHTRYGRENIGYLWMIGEPGLLAIAVAAMHGGHASPLAPGVHPVPFSIGGYCAFMIFRSIVARAESALESNAPLLFHRVVSIFDILFARALLEGLSTVATLTLLLAAACALGFGVPPERPLVLLAGLGFITWFSLALSMLVCSATHANRVIAKFVHPIVYIMLPLSGAFYMLKWIPQPYRDWLAWSPLTQMFELIHAGQFESAKLTYVDPAYLIGWCLALTYFGLVAIRITRRHVQIN